MNKPNFSFEFFPTKTDDGVTKLCQTFDTLNELSPAYFSVTYGAGGTTRQRTIGIVETLHSRANTPIAPHITCNCCLYLWHTGDDKGATMRPLTDKQKSRLWEQTRNTNFQASRRLEGVTVPLVTLTAEEALARLATLRREYER